MIVKGQWWTSKGITDLSLLHLAWLNTTCPSKKLNADRTGPCNYLTSHSLVRYRNEPDKLLHQLRTPMHHNLQNRERAINLSILSMSGPGEISRVELN